jgi:hypothetical protein
MNATFRTSILASMTEHEALLAEIERLLDAGEDEDDPERLARTLTDGYARALGLETERSRLQRRIGEVTATLGAPGSTGAVDELAALDERVREYDGALTLLRDKLELLRVRHSVAVRAPTV